MAENNPQDNIGCLGWLISLFIGEPEDKPQEAKQEEPKQEEETKQEEAETKKEYSKSYQAKYLLTRNEYREFKKLAEYADAKGLRICPKVRLLDLIEPRKGEGYMSLLGKIQSKHVDFVITDKDLHIKAILELDDSSHDRADRQERDSFVDEVLASVGYKVIRTRSITENTLEEINHVSNKNC